MVNAYGGVIIVADVLLLFLKIIFYLFESIYRFFVPAEEKSVAGEIVLVTGAGHGIGRELAVRYASLGATVVCWDINQEGNEETANEIKKQGAARSFAYKCDVSSRDEVLETAEKVREEVGNVTILVNNAGIMPCHSFLTHTPEEIRKLVDVNLMSHFWMLQAFLPSMIEKNHGHVVALSSMAGIVGLPNLVPYCATKYAVRGIMDSICEEIRQISPNKINNIKFTTIYPYMVDTGLCKKPKSRFPNLLALVKPHEAADQIISAQRRNQMEITIPSYWLTVSTFVRTLPYKAILQVIDFVDSGVEAES
ncbi:short-chain dehydrogenase/reductase family 16C member 6-like [Belonocnema kinseyi]|uniref:short-chain dehydrogenase/reductase family 16C member 6-like n=1 Tax=Belonocnema kinseyi TaxID=2817044 RepID=UPI00143D3D25|nr:short-chain dehydrogenase/reductase family 16C member 6-like [Belonocnema kinseyi]XP_033208955.1 short-chain dehydrogenase/reductase family 16C member 6-like [Belonocnema kinseyi]